MAGFRLAGVLRLRRIEEDRARLRLVDAHADLAQTAESAGGVAAYLDASPERPADGVSLAAIAASRAASSALLAVLEAEQRLRAQDVDDARAELNRRRTASKGLEKLERRHVEATERAEGRAEQLVLDEVASTARRTAERGDAP